MIGDDLIEKYSDKNWEVMKNELRTPITFITNSKSTNTMARTKAQPTYDEIKASLIESTLADQLSFISILKDEIDVKRQQLELQLKSINSLNGKAASHDNKEGRV